jgi:AcrR family transcriptional regulator
MIWGKIKSHRRERCCWRTTPAAYNSGVSERRGRGRPRDNPRVEADVVKATLAEIEEKGLANCTVESIAARAGIGKATFYRRWPNKEAVLYFLASRLTHVVEPIDTGDLRKDLLSVIEPVRKVMYGGSNATVVPTFLAEAARDPRMREFVSKFTEEGRMGAIHALERAKRRGELRRDVDLDAVVDMIYGSFEGRFLNFGERVTAAYIRKVVDLALYGIVKQ